jgi:hypothetical protein
MPAEAAKRARFVMVASGRNNNNSSRVCGVIGPRKCQRRSEGLYRAPVKVTRQSVAVCRNVLGQDFRISQCVQSHSQRRDILQKVQHENINGIVRWFEIFSRDLVVARRAIVEIPIRGQAREQLIGRLPPTSKYSLIDSNKGSAVKDRLPVMSD